MHNVENYDNIWHADFLLTSMRRLPLWQTLTRELSNGEFTSMPNTYEGVTKWRVHIKEKKTYEEENSTLFLYCFSFPDNCHVTWPWIGSRSLYFHYICATIHFISSPPVTKCVYKHSPHLFSRRVNAFLRLLPKST